MAVDGSFRLESELMRFLDRRPKLKSLACFSNLLNKGDLVTEEEVVHAAAQLLLHPKYTVPLLGCFRAIAQKIVERTVTLLKDLEREDHDCVEEFDEEEFLRDSENVDSAEVANIIDIYVDRKKGLRLHELACLAFYRALDLIPFLLGSILKYFRVAPAPFKRFVQQDIVSSASSMGANQLLNVVQASYGFLLLEDNVFLRLWDWSCYLDLVQKSSTLILLNGIDLMKIISDSRCDSSGLRNIVYDIKWCSVKILSLVLGLSFKANSNLDHDSEESVQSLLRWKGFCAEVSLEKGSWYLESPVQDSLAVAGRKVDTNGGHCLRSCRLSYLSTFSGDRFTLTCNMMKSFEMVYLAVSQRWPVLLYGPSGSGKSVLIDKLAHIHGSKVLHFHMDEQIDGKTLIGSYVSTEQPGEFRWQPGSLVQAVLHGFWVVFEDIDKAPPDVISILLPLLEGSGLLSTGHGEAVRVHEDFRLFSTVTSSNLEISQFLEERSLLGNVWRKVMIGQPSDDDFQKIVSKWYPELESLAPKLIETFERVVQLTRSQPGLTTLSSNHDRFTLRDLLKLCKRIANVPDRDSFLPDACNCIYKELVDVFASFNTSTGNRLAIMREMAKLWNVTTPRSLYPVNKPIVQELGSELQVGRVFLKCTGMALKLDKKTFVQLHTSVHVLEKIACSVNFNEPVLLVGETGTGKTTLVQTLANRIGRKLIVLNLSQQSDVADMLGGFKPVDARLLCNPLHQEFESLFANTFSLKDNVGFLSRLRKSLIDKNWDLLFIGLKKGVKAFEIGKSSIGKKRKRPLSEELLEAWGNFSVKLEKAHAQLSSSDGMVFSFVEGAFVKALRNGEWILLDEVNLAPPDMLQRIIGVLGDEKGSVCLSERGDIDYVCRHADFRMFACMNPATDAGKRDLPLSIRSRFTEYFVDHELNREDLVLFVNQFMDDDPSKREWVDRIVEFYEAAKDNEEMLQDGANQKPHYSLRSLYRALEHFRKAKRWFGFEKSIYDGFSMFFLNLLDDSSAKLMHKLIKNLLGGKIPPELPFDSYLKLTHKLIKNSVADDYVLTKSVKEHLNNLAKAIFVHRYPILLQGPTSSGKTSLVRFLAKITCNEFVRINNHEHTDLQEYLGSYITDASGKLVFQEGALVKAVREGHWIVLDELNLAPSDVLEALNRLLDDNRELFVPELCETIRAHPEFMLFATQNPPVFYAGRKMLSRAFRNRFVEIHVDEIPQEELSTILEQKCIIPESYAKKMVNVMKELQLHRQSSKVFAGKHGFITPRDLFRWAKRYNTYGGSYDDLARDGYYLLAERLRDDAEKTIVKEVLERQLKVKLSEKDLYKQENYMKEELSAEKLKKIGKITWTKSLRRMYFLIERCYKMHEPVLLVGETGGGKTTVCQLLSEMFDLKLHVLNCHRYTEASDFLGGFHPVRDRSKIIETFQSLCEQFTHSKAFMFFPGEIKLSTDINQASQTLDIIRRCKEQSFAHPEITEGERTCIEEIYMDLCKLDQTWQSIFMWQDGPLVEAMKRGHLFLADEISLADDSVLERLNSVLEPERKLSLAEKGGSHLENITGHSNFFFLATMNPGGDYGKKELSPALRNRFTEIWIPSVSDIDDLKDIVLDRMFLSPKPSRIVDIMLNFWEWFNMLETGRLLTVRDLLSWVSFVNVTQKSLPAESSLIHGAFLVALDGLSLGTNISKGDVAKIRCQCLSFLQDKVKEYEQCSISSKFDALVDYGWADSGSLSVLHTDNMDCDNLFGIHPFYIEKGNDPIDTEGFQFLAPTTRKNTLRLLRAMQLNKPVLLEGSPGVGKTSLIVALGRFSGHSVVRINLSEQTDLMDLLGSDFPVESDEGLQFAWSDGILLQALKKGSWVLLDELNLAPQSVLEGLNAILDHRAEVFIPELGCSFKCPSSFRVFACQNPSGQGGGRKGLPKSFLNRFTKVYVDELVEEDHISICSSLFPSIERSLLLKLVTFNERLHHEIMVRHKFGEHGSPWEFNLRDMVRSCQIIQGASEKSKSDCFLSTVYLQRMRTPADRLEVLKLYEQIFGFKPFINPYPRVQLNPYSFVVGDISIERFRYPSSGLSSKDLKVLPCLRHCLEGVAQCVKYQWLCILVGPPASGKTSLIRLLADLTGNVLNELNLSSATDISDLLGCFEQHNAARHLFLAIAQVEKYMNEYCNLQLEFSQEGLIRKKHLISRWLAFLSNANNGSSTASLATFIDNSRMRSSISHLVEIIEDLKLDNDKQNIGVSWSNKDLDVILNMIRKLEDDLKKGQSSKKFEWVNGLLIKAIQKGEWIVLKNANLCNPTVLDRINSLVEHSGSITINERGTADGKPLVLPAHPKFRMFFTVNPSYGEVSRAMRNRGVEICMMQPYWLVDETSGKNLDEFVLRDVKRFITLSEIPVGKLVEMMAKAHIYAMKEGSHLNVSITYLELSRWVQLFRRLITNGNRPCWSIQISWEHTYLSSFGEGKGRDIVSQAAVSYLSVRDLYKFTTAEDCLLNLPGGWPSPSRLSDYICYSRETCVRQNCMYLESLGSQIASYIRSSILKGGLKGLTALDGASRMIGPLDATLLCELMFPKASDNSVLVNRGRQCELDLVLAQKRLTFAADWVVEQVTENDHHLYVHWFDWFGTRLQQFFSFSNWHSDLCRKEPKPPAWTRIFHLLSTDKESSLPIIPVKLIDLFPSSAQLKSCHVLLINSMKCASQFGLSLRQWSFEEEYGRFSEIQRFLPVLMSLRRLEEKLLHVLVESPSFDLLFKLYVDLLEHHILLWNIIISSDFDCLLIPWRSLMKDASKLQQICPTEVKNFHIVMKALDGVSSFHLNSRKSLLQKHGGHPILPSSAESYHKQYQLLNFCELIWPRKREFLKLGRNVADNASTEGNDMNEISMRVALSSNVELRLLAMQGVCMSSYITGNADDGDFDIQQLEEMYQMLLGRLDFEKQKLKARVEAMQRASSLVICPSCCLLTSDALCMKSGFECWLQTQSLVDETTSFRDLELLQHLTEIAVHDTEEQHNALSVVAGDLDSALNFSLSYSSRPPTDFLPHQKILWIISAWASVQQVGEKISSCILEMWLKWHISLWEACPMVETRGSDILIPNKLFHPLKLVLVNQILQNSESIGRYMEYKFKIMVASRNIWHSTASVISSHDMLLSAARSLFQQIIYAHKRSFEDPNFAKIKSAFHSIQILGNSNETIENLISLLRSSNHRVFASLIDSCIVPLLKELYSVCFLNDVDVVQKIGKVFVRIGFLRYNLLICCDDLDPTVKYSIKYSELTEKIDSLEIEIQVRRECLYLAGSAPLGETSIHSRMNMLERLNAERRRLRRKMVFRSSPGKFRKLKHECDYFLKLVVGWTKNLECLGTENITEQLQIWQESSSRFIDRLSNEYSAYLDIVEPILVAIYEMKLGLSFFAPSILNKKYVANEERPMNLCLEAIYGFMRFPRGCASKTISVDSRKKPNISIGDIDLPVSIADIDLLKNMASSTSASVCDAMASSTLMTIAVYHNFLARIKIFAADAHFLSYTSFKVLDEIFDKVCRHWMDWMDHKHQIKIKESQWFNFSRRAFKIESITQVDVSKFSELLASDSFREWQEMLSDETAGKISAKDKDEIMEHDWNLFEESHLDDMVNIHNQLFGSVDLIKKPCSIKVSDANRLSSFYGSYMLGIEMTRDLKGSLSSIFDAKIAPEHLLRLCLEHDEFFPFTKSTSAYNFYKDSNSCMLVALVEPVSSLKQKILEGMKEYDDHPALQKILEVVDMILFLPLDTPLAKALSGLQFLLSRVQSAQETFVKFPRTDQLKPICTLISSWHKLELESFPTLLDEVQFQIERNAGRLWFPLYSIFRHDSSTTKSLEDFFKTSCIGDFKKQLQLILSLHGHISKDIRDRSYSPYQEENVKILYNCFGIYVQFLPRILEHIQTNRRSTEMQLKEVLKLHSWDRIDNQSAFDNMKRVRQKIRKIIQKFTDVLQEPLMPFLEPASWMEINSQSIQGSGHFVDSYDNRRNLLKTVFNETQCKDTESSIWFADWWHSTKLAMERIHSDTPYTNLPDVFFNNIGELVDDMKHNIPSQPSYFLYLERKQSWHIIGKLCSSLHHSDELWENKHKNLIKRRAFSDLLKLLDNCGLSRHRTSTEEQSKERWLRQPSYEMQHLLLAQSDISYGNSDSDLKCFQNSPHEVIWNASNKYYFKSISSKEVLDRISKKFHKDLTREQVQRSGSYIDHLVEIQQEQRSAVYHLEGKLKHLRQCMLSLSNMLSSSVHSDTDIFRGFSFSNNRYTTFNCLWQQKQLFDAFCTMMYEAHLLLQTVENNHLNTCSSVKFGAEKIRLFFQNVLPDFQKSKNLLDHHLLGTSKGLTMGEIKLCPYGVTKEMELLVNENFQLIKTFKDNLSALHGTEDGKLAVVDVLLRRFEDLFVKGQAISKEFNSSQARNLPNSSVWNPNHGDGNICESNLGFDDALKGIYKNILGVFQRIGSLMCDSALTEESSMDVKGWKTLFENDVELLQVDLICEDVVKILQSSEELLNSHGDGNSNIISDYFRLLRRLYILLERILAFGDNLLRDFLEIHSMVCMLAHVLANIFASLFAQGFGTVEDQENDCVKERTQDVMGTGMGEGSGLNDVSDQIDDEDQLLGTSDKPNEERDATSEIPSKNEKGVEMEQDFDGDAFSVSEDSDEDRDEDNEDEQLESAMGEVGQCNNVVDEKLGGIDDENENHDGNEKYDNGPSVKDKVSNDEELRAREDSVTAKEDAGDICANISNEDGMENEGHDDAEDMNLDEDNAFSDRSGINPDEKNQWPEEDIHMDDAKSFESMEDGESEDFNDLDAKNDDEKSNILDEDGDLGNSVKNAETSDTEENGSERDTEMAPTMPNLDDLQSTNNLVPENITAAQSSGQPKQDSKPADFGDFAADEILSDFNEAKNDLAPASSLQDASALEVGIADSANGKRLSQQQHKTSVPSESLIQESLPNPYRSVGEALDGWKERVKVSLDIQDPTENSDDLMDDDTDEYGYTAEYEKGTAQALGPATADQINGDIAQNDVNMETRNTDAQDPSSDTKIDEQTSVAGPTKNPSVSSISDDKAQKVKSDLEKQLEDYAEDDGDIGRDHAGLSENLVAVQRSFMREDLNQLTKFPVSDNGLGKAPCCEPPGKVRDDAVVLWKRYEVLTTRLSQELSGQLRLVMEPTSASGFQGDYRSGPKINLKKVIPYVASHYRKDKIWLRRTRPGKRDYQVVIAVDDSRSMSEGHCGSFAIEALVTVCRAMSLLDVGNLAVASFGQHGNVRLLHNFDQPFTAEAGIKMISNLTFKQENTIADEPMADLLKYLNNMLDVTAVRARRPSGYNLLQQLVLIIADGRFNEKEHLKRYVRDILNKKRMVAFLLLDSPNESIIDLMEATVKGKDITFTKYLDSFPFPFYVVLKNIEALPRTLADLLRQWFELMHTQKE